MTNPRGGPPHTLLEEAQGVLQVEAPHVGAPQEIEVRRCPLWPMPPQPQDPRLAPPFAAGQPLDLDQGMSVPTTMGRGPRVPRPSWFWTFGCSSAHARRRTAPYNRHPRSGARSRARARYSDRCTSHLRPAKLATRASDVFWRVAEARIAVPKRRPARKRTSIWHGLPSSARCTLTGS